MGIRFAKGTFVVLPRAVGRQLGRPWGAVGPALFCLALGTLLGCTSIPNGRAAIDAVDFDGVHNVSETDVGDKIATTPTSKFVGLFRGVMYDYEIYDPYVLSQDLQRVERYYRSQGYYEAHARAARVEYPSPNHVRVLIVVDEGVPVLLKEVRVEGADALPPKIKTAVDRAVAVSGLTVGDRFQEDDFAGGEWHIQHALERNGYAFAKVERSARIDLPNHVAAVVYKVTPDLPATLGKVTITGLGSLPEAPVRRAIDLHEGQPYSSTDLDDAQQAGLDLGVFSAVAVVPDKPDPPPADHIVPVNIEVTPTKLRTLELGGGIEFDPIKTDIHGRGGWTDRNFLGGLRKFSVDFRPGFVLYPTRLPDFQVPERLLPEERTRVELRQPGVFEARTSGYVRGELNVYPLLLTSNVKTTDPVVGYIEGRTAVGVDRTFWKLYANLSYNIQDNYPFAYISSRPLDPDVHGIVVSYFDLLTNFDFRDDKVEPHKGVYLGNELQVAGLGGDARDIRVQPQIRGYIPVRHSTIALRATAGMLFPYNYGSIAANTPIGQEPQGVSRADWIRDLQLVFFRGYFSGGSTSNRGYPVFGVGPHGPVPFLTASQQSQQTANLCHVGDKDYDPTRCALPLGGQTLWEFSAEFRLPITASLGQVTFCDTSDVEKKQMTFDFGPRDLHLSCGVGVRYKTPAGPIRFDIAYRIPGLNPQPGDPDYANPILGVPLGVAFGIGEAY